VAKYRIGISRLVPSKSRMIKRWYGLVSPGYLYWGKNSYVKNGVHFHPERYSSKITYLFGTRLFVAVDSKFQDGWEEALNRGWAAGVTSTDFDRATIPPDVLALAHNMDLADLRRLVRGG